VDVTITAQEIPGGQRELPDSEIEENSHNFRPLGLGYANLGALLMSMALPVRLSGRPGHGWRDHRADVRRKRTRNPRGLRERMGPFPGYEVNREPMLDVIRMHRDAMRGIQPEHVQTELFMPRRNRGTPRWRTEKSMATRMRR